MTHKVGYDDDVIGSFLQSRKTFEKLSFGIEFKVRHLRDVCEKNPTLSDNGSRRATGALQVGGRRAGNALTDQGKTHCNNCWCGESWKVRVNLYHLSQPSSYLTYPKEQCA